MRRLRALHLAFGLLWVLPLGCGGDDTGSTGAGVVTAPEVPEAPSVPDAAIELPPEDAPRYSYNSIGKRDPFRSFIQKELVVQRDGGPLGPLQLHEIDEYQLSGIVWNIEEPRALMEDPDGIGHVIELGTLVGKNWGKVTQIKPDEIVITEEYRDPIENELIINEVTKRLPNPSREGKKR